MSKIIERGRIWAQFCDQSICVDLFLAVSLSAYRPLYSLIQTLASSFVRAHNDGLHAGILARIPLSRRLFQTLQHTRHGLQQESDFKLYWVHPAISFGQIHHHVFCASAPNSHRTTHSQPRSKEWPLLAHCILPSHNYRKSFRVYVVPTIRVFALLLGCRRS